MTWRASVSKSPHTCLIVLSGSGIKAAVSTVSLNEVLRVQPTFIERWPRPSQDFPSRIHGLSTFAVEKSLSLYFDFAHPLTKRGQGKMKR